MADKTKPAPKKYNAELTKEAILIAATEEFSRHGLNGARVDTIAASTGMAKRMIYYYFGSKEGLYAAVLERAYNCIRAAERGLNLTQMPPLAAIRRLTEFTFDYEEANVDFIRLVAIENTHFGEHINQSNRIKTLNVPIIDALDEIIGRGRQAGVFRPDVEAFDLHCLISSFCFFRVSNQYTLAAVFKRDMMAPDIRQRHKQMLVDAVLGYVTRRNGEPA